MKSTLPLALFGAILLAGCDSTAQEGTSSETQTALQELADNATSIISNSTVPLATASPVGSARRMSTSMDSIMCAGYPWQSTYQWRMDTLLVDRFWMERDSLGPGVGPDGTASTCSVSESHHMLKSIHLDSVARLRSIGTYVQTGNLFHRSFEGSGIIDFRTGASFRMSHYSRHRTGSQDTISESLSFKGNCSVEFSYVTGSELPSGVDAPVICGEKMVGRFSWDLISSPVVTDLSGRKIAPSHRPPISFPEDSLGLHATIVDAGLDSGDTTAHLRARFVLNLLPGDTAMDTMYLQSAGATERAWFGRSSDTLMFRFDRDALQELRTDTFWGSPPRFYFLIGLRNGRAAISRTFTLTQF